MYLYLLCFVFGALVGAAGLLAFFCLMFLVIDEERPREDQPADRKIRNWIPKKIDLTYH